MLLMNPHPHFIRINPFAEAYTVGRIEEALQSRGGVLSVGEGERRYGFHSFVRRDTALDDLRALFGPTSVDAEDGPYYVMCPPGRRRWRAFDRRALGEPAVAF